MSIAIRRDASLIVRELDGETVVLDTRSNQVHHLNRTASAIWNLCAQQLDMPSMARTLAAEFDVDEATALADVEETISRFRALALLQDEG